MHRWLALMILVTLVGISAAAPQNPLTGGVVSILEKHGLLMDPDGYDRNVNGNTRHGLLMDPDG